jgi:hypothetical protein
VVTEVPADLAGNRRNRERQEVGVTSRFEAVHRIDQTDCGYLKQIIQRLTATGKAAGYVPGDRKIATDQLITPPPPIRMSAASSAYRRCS